MTDSEKDGLSGSDFEEVSMVAQFLTLGVTMATTVGAADVERAARMSNASPSGSATSSSSSEGAKSCSCLLASATPALARPGSLRRAGAGDSMGSAAAADEGVPEGTAGASRQGNRPF